jgi:peptidoglycan/xylan/chitin deacetylase (PgdA/CDA1 family)
MLSHEPSAEAPALRDQSTWLQVGLQLLPVPRLNVLIFHRVLRQSDPLRPAEPTVDEFEARMRWVSANFDVLPFSEAVKALAAGRLSRRALSITFDDGYADNHDLALPALKKAGLTATFFVATGYLDGGCMFNDAVIEAVRKAPGHALDLSPFGMDRYPLTSDDERRAAIARILETLKYLPQSKRQAQVERICESAGAAPPRNLMMTSGQVAALHRAGMEIGAHTVSHPILAKIGIDEARNEITRGRGQLEEIIGARVGLFAYPNGRPRRDYEGEHVALVRRLGFDAAVSTAWGAARAGCDMFQIPRFTPWDRSDLGFALRLLRNALKADYEMA